MNTIAAAQGAVPQGMPQGAPPGGLGGPGGGMGLLGGPTASIALIALLLVTFVVLAVAFWRLFGKAGLAPWLGALMVVPVVNLGVALYLAFAEWPALREMQRLHAIAATAAQP